VVSLQLLGRSYYLLVALSSGVFELPAVLVATNPKFLGDEMAGCHLLLLGRSSDLRHVDELDVLLSVTIKKFVPSSGRALASSCNLDVFLLLPLVRWRLVEGLLLAPTTKTTGRPLCGPKCNFPFLRGCLCKSCNVNLKTYM
jgi:hypothetical protein